MSQNLSFSKFFTGPLPPTCDVIYGRLLFNNNSNYKIAWDSLEGAVGVDAEAGRGEVHELVRVAEVRAPRVRERAVRGLVEVRHLRYHLHTTRYIYTNTIIY